MDPEQLAARMRALTAPFSTGQLVTLVVTFVLVIGLVAGSAYWLSQPTYATLYANLDEGQAYAVSAKLKALKVPYELSAGQVRVPASRVEELKLQFNVDGVVDVGQQPGDEVLNQNPFNITNTMEQKRILQAREGEIARTLSQMDGVSKVRVHIAPGKDEVFGASRPPTASVTLWFRNGRTLPPGAVTGIANLVSASVGGGMRPDDVSIVDGSLKPLNKPKAPGEEPLGEEQLELRQSIERDLTAKAMQLLAPSLGDQVRVSVTATLNQSSRTVKEYKVDPQQTAPVSLQELNENQTSGVTAAPPGPPPGVAPGTAGARGNLPAPAATPAQQTQLQQGPTSTRTSKTVNQENSNVTTSTVVPPGEITRLAVSVVVDDRRVVKDQNGTSAVSRVPRTPEELKKIQDTVATAVGLDPARGDQITVQNLSFQEETVGQEVEAPNVLVKFQPQIEEGARVGGLLLVALLAFLFVVRPLMQKVTGSQLAVASVGAQAMPELPSSPRPMTVAELQALEEARLIEGEQVKLSESVRAKALLKRTTEAAQQQPQHLAKVIQTMIADAGR